MKFTIAALGISRKPGRPAGSQKGVFVVARHVSLLDGAR